MAARRLATVFLLAAIVAQAADATLSLSSTSSRRRSPAPPPAPIPPIPPQSSGLPFWDLLQQDCMRGSVGKLNKSAEQAAPSLNSHAISATFMACRQKHLRQL